MRVLSSVLLVALLAGCATPRSGANWSPVVDRPGANYYNDLRDCQQHATGVMSAQDAAVGGAVAGAIFGALLGAAAGGNSRFNTQMAGVGALSSGSSAAAAAEGGQRGIIRRCLVGRGHAVLN